MPKTLEERLNAYPKLKQQMVNLLEITESGIEKADEAEQRTVDGIRELGQQVLQDWAEHQAQEKADAARDRDEKPAGEGKKKFTGILRSEK